MPRGLRSSAKINGKIIKYDSKLEASVHNRNPKLSRQTERVNYRIPHKYTPDFLVHVKNQESLNQEQLDFLLKNDLLPGDGVLIETKGYLSAEDKMKMKYVVRSLKEAGSRQRILLVLSVPRSLNALARSRTSDARKYAAKVGLLFATADPDGNLDSAWRSVLDLA
jgi:hypothetical protein